MLVHRSLKQRILSIFFAGACAGANVAMAQDSPVLEEVVVVAQKREQSLQEVPMAVSAFTGDSLRDAGVNTVEALSRQAPSLQVQASNNASAVNYRIRRVGNIGSIPTFEPAVGVFIDGAYRSRPLFTAGELFDIERVEVLRGPQSTLYGKNTTAGVVAIYTRAPAAEFEGNAQLDVGQLDGASWTPFYRVVGGVSGPLSDTVSASIGGNLVGQDHTYEGALASSRPEANDLHRQALRGQLQWTPSDALSVRLIAGYMQEDDNTTQGDVHFVAGSPAAISRNILVATGNAQPCASNDSLDQLHCSLTAPETDLKASEVTLLVDYALNNGMTLTSISSWDWFRNEWAQFDAAQLGSPLLRHQDTQEATSWQEELRLSSTGGETVDWLAGMFFYQNNFDRGDHGKTYTFLEDTLSAAPVPSMLLQQRYGTPFPVPFAAPGQNGYYAASQDTDYFGIFGQATWNISDKFAITGGVRWQNEDKKASLAQGVTVPGFSLMSVALLPRLIGGDLDRSTQDTTWSVTPQYFFSDDLNVYATVSHGFKSGGFNVGWGTTPMNQREFADEDIMNYEAGLKSTLLDGRMQLALSAFHTEYDDYQEAAYVSQQFTVGNAEKVELNGFELDGKTLLGEHFSSDFGISYADLKYKEFTKGLCYPGRTPDNPVTGTCDLSGEHPIDAPEWVTHLGLEYQTDVSFGTVFARTDWSWSSEYNTSFSADPRLIQDSYSWVNFRAGIRWDRFEVTGWVVNALNEKVVNFDALLNLFPNDPSYQTYRQPPLSYGVTLRVDF